MMVFYHEFVRFALGKGSFRRRERFEPARNTQVVACGRNVRALVFCRPMYSICLLLDGFLHKGSTDLGLI